MADEATIVDDVLRRAREHFSAGRIADAALVIKHAIDTAAPNSITLHVALAEAFWELGRAREAVDVARRATQIEPNNKLAWRTLGIALVRSGQAAEAQQQLAALVRI